MSKLYKIDFEKIDSDEQRIFKYLNLIRVLAQKLDILFTEDEIKLYKMDSVKEVK